MSKGKEWRAFCFCFFVFFSKFLYSRCKDKDKDGGGDEGDEEEEDGDRDEKKETIMIETETEKKKVKKKKEKKRKESKQKKLVKSKFQKKKNPFYHTSPPFPPLFWKRGGRKKNETKYDTLHLFKIRRKSSSHHPFPPDRAIFYPFSFFSQYSPSAIQTKKRKQLSQDSMTGHSLTPSHFPLSFSLSPPSLFIPFTRTSSPPPRSSSHFI